MRYWSARAGVGSEHRPRGVQPARAEAWCHELPGDPRPGGRLSRGMQEPVGVVYVAHRSSSAALEEGEVLIQRPRTLCRKRVGLGGHLLGGLGCNLLIKQMDDGALPNIEQLDLSLNNITEHAVRRPTDAVCTSSCPRLPSGPSTLWGTEDWQLTMVECGYSLPFVSHHPLQAFLMAGWLAKGLRPSLQRLLLGYNRISGLMFANAGLPEEVGGMYSSHVHHDYECHGFVGTPYAHLCMCISSHGVAAQAQDRGAAARPQPPRRRRTGASAPTLLQPKSHAAQPLQERGSGYVHYTD
jgi:hypothetical protein